MPPSATRLRLGLLLLPLLALSAPPAPAAPTCGMLACADADVELRGADCVIHMPSGRMDCWVIVQTSVHASSPTPGTLVFELDVPGHFTSHDACPYTTGSCEFTMMPTVELTDVAGRCETLTATLRVFAATAGDVQQATDTATRTFCY